MDPSKSFCALLKEASDEVMRYGRLTPRARELAAEADRLALLYRATLVHTLRERARERPERPERRGTSIESVTERLETGSGND